MAHSKEVREAVKRHYVHDRMPLEQAAKLRDVSPATVGRWKKEAAENGDDWDKQRAALLLAGDGIEAVARQMLADYLIQHQAMMEEISKSTDINAGKKVEMLASLADSFNKTVAASKRVLPETNELATAMDVVQKLADFIRTHYPQHARIFAEVLEPFGDELAKTYG